jgi:hypothetical protein
MDAMDKDQIKAQVAYLLAQAEQLKHSQVVLLENAPEDDETIINGEVTEEIPAEPPIRNHRIPVKWAVILCLVLLCLSVVASLLFQWFFLPTAHITIVPKSQHFTTTISLPGAAIAARQLQPLSLSAAQTVVTTGHGHQKASSASGIITFYNSLPALQTMPAGTVLTGSNGTQVITDQTASIPSGSFSGYGTASVAAHSLLIGASGNIPAGSIQGACCKAYVLVYSGAFSGGADERDFPMVTDQDISHAATALTTQMTKGIQTMLTSQIQPSESLVTPLSCTPKTSTDHKTGEETKTVTVTIKQTCSGIAYNTQQLQEHIQPVFSSTVAKQLPSYSVTGNPEPGSIAVVSKDSALLFSLPVTGNCQYLFTNNKLHQIQELVKGKSRDEALVLLLHYQGIQSVGITLSGITNQLPSDPGHINVSVMGSA